MAEFNLIDAGEEFEVEVVPVCFKINSPEVADWAVRRIKEEREEAERLQNIARSQILELDEKIRSIDRDLERRTSYLMHCLQEYMSTVKTKDTKTQKSFKLLSGSLVYKMPTVEYKRDDDKLTEWLEKNVRKSLIEYSKKPKWAELKKQISVVDGVAVMTDTGEIIDGIEISEKEGRFEVK